MAIQVKKEKRKIIDRGNKYDPGNYHSDRDYNPTGLTKITQDVIDFYISCKNMNCPLNYYNKLLKLDVDPPECLETCNKKLTVHGCGPNGQYPVVEFMTRYVKSDPLRIYIKRGDALFNVYHSLPFIFRPDWSNGFVLHHVFGPLYDDPNFTRVIKTDKHNKINSKLKKLNNQISEIQILLDKDENNIILKKAIAELKNQHFKISNVENSDEFWGYIDRTYSQISNVCEV